MLSFDRQYDIAHGIFITYDSNLDHRLLHSSHKKKTRENFKNVFPYKKFEGRHKETFVLACLWVMFDKTPSSFHKMLEFLRAVNLKEISAFKHKIVNYIDYMKKDVSYLRENYGKPTPHEVLKEFANGNIEFYTAWWFLKLFKDDISYNRVELHIMRRLKFINLFLTFKESSIEKIQNLLEEIEL